MAVSVVQAKAGINNGGGTSGFTQFASNTTTGNTIVALVQWGKSTAGAASLSSVTDSVGGNVYTIVAIESLSSPNFAGNIATAIAYCVNATGGATPTITMNFSAATSFDVMNIFELSASVFDQSIHANGVGTSISAGSITTTVNGCVGICGSVTDDGVGAGGGWTKGTGWDTLLQNTGGGSTEWGCEYVSQVTAGALAGTFTQSRSGTWAASYGTFKPSTPPTYNITPQDTNTQICANGFSDGIVVAYIPGVGGSSTFKPLLGVGV